MTAAARVLGETKGSVSRRVSRLERALGAALIQRSGGRAQPTPLGQGYYRSAGQALQLLAAAGEEMRNQNAAPSGHLRITALQGVGPDVLAGPIGRFIKAFPGVTLEVLLTERNLSFRDDHIDFAFRPAVGQLPDSTHMAHRLFDIAVSFVASPAYLEAHGTPTHPWELEGHRLLLSPMVGQGWRLPMRRRGQPDTTRVLDLKGNVLTHDTGLLLGAAIAGGGITLLIPDRGQPVVAGGALVRLFEDWEQAMHATIMLIHPAGPMTPKAIAFKDFIRADFARQVRAGELGVAPDPA